MWTKNKKAHAKIILQAIALVIVIHALLLVLFRLPDSAPVQETARNNHISLLPVNSNKFDLKAFNNWLVYADPTLVAKPNDNFGYGVLTRRQGMRPETQTVKVALLDSRYDFSRIITQPSKLELSSNTTIAPLPDFNVAPPAVSPRLRFPIVVTNEGNTIQGVFAGVINLEETIKTAPVTGPSVIQLTSSTSAIRLPRFRLLQSCGDPTLDQLAVRTLISSVSLINGGSGNKELSVYWKTEGEVEK